MSDFAAPDPQRIPPPPGSGGPPGASPPPPPPPPGPFATPSPTGGGWPTNPQPDRATTPYGAAPGVAPVRPARPPVTVGAIGLLLGGAMLIIGSFVTWFSLLGIDVTGFTSGSDDTVRDGPVFLTLGIVIAILGILLLALKRLLGVAIAGVVVGVIAVVAALADLGDVSDAQDTALDAGIDFTIGPGLYLCVVGGVLSIAGGVIAIVKRRR